MDESYQKAVPHNRRFCNCHPTIEEVAIQLESLGKIRANHNVGLASKAGQDRTEEASPELVSDEGEARQ